jgi:hypothetical protein
MGGTARISSFLALQHSTVGVLAMVVLVGMGERMIDDDTPDVVSPDNACNPTPEKIR